MKNRVDRLVQQFRTHTKEWAKASQSDSAEATRHDDLVLEAFDELAKHGDSGRDALMVLFADPDPEVRTSAAAFLLRHCTSEAQLVLREVAKGKGMVAFSAEQALQRWEEGTWSLDPDPSAKRK